MKRSTLIFELALKYKYLNHPQVERMVEQVFKHMANVLSQGQRIELRNFGTWAVKTRKPRIARNPRTGEKISVSEKKTIGFRMAKLLKFKMNKDRFLSQNVNTNK